MEHTNVSFNLPALNQLLTFGLNNHNYTAWIEVIHDVTHPDDLNVLWSLVSSDRRSISSRVLKLFSKEIARKQTELKSNPEYFAYFQEPDDEFREHLERCHALNIPTNQT